jgi:hypothetical protein
MSWCSIPQEPCSIIIAIVIVITTTIIIIIVIIIIMIMIIISSSSITRIWVVVADACDALDWGHIGLVCPSPQVLWLFMEESGWSSRDGSRETSQSRSRRRSSGKSSQNSRRSTDSGAGSEPNTPRQPSTKGTLRGDETIGPDTRRSSSGAGSEPTTPRRESWGSPGVTPRDTLPGEDGGITEETVQQPLAASAGEHGSKVVPLGTPLSDEEHEDTCTLPGEDGGVGEPTAAHVQQPLAASADEHGSKVVPLVTPLSDDEHEDPQTP